LIAIAVALVLPAAALTQRAATPRAIVAARWTFWYTRIHNDVLGRAFGRKPAPARVVLSTPAPGVLRLANRRRTITGRIICHAVPADPSIPGSHRLTCAWQITVHRRARYDGSALVTLYKEAPGYPTRFNIETFSSKCRALQRHSHYCRDHPPPNG
jgi:hypothetical protein